MIVFTTYLCFPSSEKKSFGFGPTAVCGAGTIFSCGIQPLNFQLTMIAFVAELVSGAYGRKEWHQSPPLPLRRTSAALTEESVWIVPELSL